MTTEPAQRAQVLDTRVCWNLLRAANVGRLAMSAAERPEIFPVNFVTDHGTILFRTADGTKLAASLAARHVAFEADGYDGETGEVWSVVVKGEAEEIKQTSDVLEAMRLPLLPWQGGPKSHFVRVVPDEVTGRRFRAADPASWRNILMDAPHASPE